MKKQKKQLIILISILVIALAGFWASVYLVDSTEVIDTISVTSVIKTDAANVDEVTYTVDGNEFDFIKKNDKWVLADDPDTALNQDTVDKIISYCINLNSKSTIENPSSIEEYGLDNPHCTISFKTNDGNMYKYYIGDCFAIDGNYFAKVDGDDTIYTISNLYYSTLNTDRDSLKETSEE